MSTFSAAQPSLIQAQIWTFGYLHNDPPSGDGMVVDLRHLRNPHHDPAMQTLTGLDPVVRDHVISTPGAFLFVTSIVERVVAFLNSYGNVHHELARVFIGCQGGRHSSVAIGEYTAQWLREIGIGAEVIHTHIERPVVCRPIPPEAIP